MQDPATAIPRSWHVRRTGPPQDDVPATRAERERLRESARERADEHGLVPPLPLDEIHAHAARVVERVGLDARYRKFAAVLVNNAIWGEVVAAVPYGRRLLLRLRRHNLSDARWRRLENDRV